MGGKVLETYTDRCLKEGHEKGMQQGIQQGTDQKSREVARNLQKRGFSLEDIAEILKEPLSEGSISLSPGT